MLYFSYTIIPVAQAAFDLTNLPQLCSKGNAAVITSNQGVAF